MLGKKKQPKICSLVSYLKHKCTNGKDQFIDANILWILRYFSCMYICNYACALMLQEVLEQHVAGPSLALLSQMAQWCERGGQ